MKRSFNSHKYITVNNKFRQVRFQNFLERLQVTAQDKILDVGGYQHFWEGSNLEKNVTILNIELPQQLPPPFTWVQGDACAMTMFQDQQFDIVFSNSVIEHVGDMARQQLFAQEVQRVAKKYWVQTPYKHFPIEPHFVFPFYQYLPRQSRNFIAKVWPFSFAKMLNLDPIAEAEHIWLLGKRDLRTLFRNAELYHENFMGLTKSLIVYRT